MTIPRPFQQKRARLEIQIKECARAYGLGVVWPVKIDRINILQATFAAMAHAVSRLKLNPGLLLIDGNQAIPPHILEEALARSKKNAASTKKLSFMATALNRQSPQPQSWPKLFATDHDCAGQAFLRLWICQTQGLWHQGSSGQSAQIWPHLHAQKDFSRCFTG